MPAIAVLTLSVIAPAATYAQTGAADGTYSQPADMRTLGAQEGHSAPAEAFRPELTCKRHNECLIVINNNPEYLVSGFYINDDGAKMHDGSIKWSGNLFRPDFMLQLHRAWWVHRSTKLGCLILAKAEIRERKHRNHLWETEVQRFDTCKNAIPYTILYVNPLPEDRSATAPATKTAAPEAEH
ncbi:hypothetical protein [Sphingomonas sp. RT2P30]|uniref:hypothetical protein n=1 Tax=Parasphingomonas halimpatiens TaxID=3096162 RepID=UPI002FCB8280